MDLPTYLHPHLLTFPPLHPSIPSLRLMLWVKQHDNRALLGHWHSVIFCEMTRAFDPTLVSHLSSIYTVCAWNTPLSHLKAWARHISSSKWKRRTLKVALRAISWLSADWCGVISFLTSIHLQAVTPLLLIFRRTFGWPLPSFPLFKLLKDSVKFDFTIIIFISLVTRQLSILRDWFNGAIILNQIQLFGRMSMDLQELKFLITPLPNNNFMITHIKSGLLLYFTQRLIQADTAVCN